MSYFLRLGLDAWMLSLSTQVDSLNCLVYSESSLSWYVSEILLFKLRNIDFYLDRCNTVNKSSRKRLFEPLSSTNSYIYSMISFGIAPALSHFVIDCPGSSTNSY